MKTQKPPSDAARDAGQNVATPLAEELRIMLEGACFLFDAEADEDHPDPQGDAIELVREALTTLEGVKLAARRVPPSDFVIVDSFVESIFHVTDGKGTR